MPIFTRRQLRQTLGANHLRDTYLGTTTQSVAPVPFAQVVVDLAVADLSLSGQNLYVGSWLRVFGGDLRVATFNAGSGAYVSTQYGAFVGVPSVGTPYERHDALPPTDKDRAIDEAVKALRVRQEVGIALAASQTFVALPAGVERVLDGYFFFSASAAYDRDRVRFDELETVRTPTGVEVRFGPAPTGAGQLVLDTVQPVTLLTGEDATISVPDERLILDRAEAICWGMLARRAPRGTADEYKRLQQEAEVRYQVLAQNFRVPDRRVLVAQPLRLGEVW